MNYINKQKIPKGKTTLMAIMISNSVEDYFRDPKHQADFEKWIKERNKKEG